MKGKGKGWLKHILGEAQRLSVYDVGETIEGLARKLNKNSSEILKLNSNENFFVSKEFLKNLLDEVIEEIDPRIYPRDEKTELKEALSKYVNVSPDQIIVGTGSDQLIDLISRALLRHGDITLTITPTFSMYERCVRIQGAELITVPLRKDFSLDVKKILDARSHAKIIFLCSPNNPTANQFEVEEIRLLMDEFDGLIVVDEAYVEFSERTIVPFVEKSENLVVLRTFSKALGLAGLRLGYAVSNSDLASTLSQRFQMPYAATLTGLKMAIKLLERMNIIKDAVTKLKGERGKLIKRINGIVGAHAFNSQTNFVLMRVDRSSDEVYEALLDRGIIIRNLGRVLHLENCLRVTVPAPAMIDRFITELKGVFDGRGS